MAEVEQGEKRSWGDEESEEAGRSAKRRMTERTFHEKQEFQAYESLVIKVKELVGTELPDLKTDMTRRKCLVCQVHWFSGWKGLMDHARTFARRKMQEHRGYYRALVEILTPNQPKNTGSDNKPVQETEKMPETEQNETTEKKPEVEATETTEKKPETAQTETTDKKAEVEATETTEMEKKSEEEQEAKTD